MVPVRRVQQRRPVSNAPGPIAFFCSRCGEIRACSALFSRGFLPQKAGSFFLRVISCDFPGCGRKFSCGSVSIGKPGPLRSLEGTKAPPRGWGGPPCAGPFPCAYSSPGRHIFQQGSRIFSMLFLSYTIITSPITGPRPACQITQNAGCYHLLMSLSAPS